MQYLLFPGSFMPMNPEVADAVSVVFHLKCVWRQRQILHRNCGCRWSSLSTADTAPQLQLSLDALLLAEVL
jgi:hypothetical protein